MAPKRRNQPSSNDEPLHIEETKQKSHSKRSRKQEEEDNDVQAPQKRRQKFAKAQKENGAASIPHTEAKRGRCEDKPNQLKICFWNLNGLRAVLKNGNILKDFVDVETPDIICMNETRINQDQSDEFINCIQGYRGSFCCSEKKGYAGVGCFIKDRLNAQVNCNGLNEEDLDKEGRVQTLEISVTGIPTFYIVNTYVLNAGQKLVRLNDKIDRFNPILYNYLNSLRRKHPVVWCGDLNVAHQEIDIWNSKANQKSAGHTPQERSSFSDFLSGGSDGPWIDVFRYYYPDSIQYTYWSGRFPTNYTNNKGWRLDYFVVSEDFLPYCKDVITFKDIRGSDHCPLILIVTPDMGCSIGC